MKKKELIYRHYNPTAVYLGGLLALVMLLLWAWGMFWTNEEPASEVSLRDYTISMLSVFLLFFVPAIVCRFCSKTYYIFSAEGMKRKSKDKVIEVKWEEIQTIVRQGIIGIFSDTPYSLFLEVKSSTGEVLDKKDCPGDFMSKNKMDYWIACEGITPWRYHRIRKWFPVEVQGSWKYSSSPDRTF